MAIADLQSISSSRGLLATETFSKVGSLFDYGIKRYKVLSWEARQPRLRLGVWRLTRWRDPTPLTKPSYIPKTYRNTKNLSIFFCTPFIWDSFSGTNRTFNVFSHTISKVKVIQISIQKYWYDLKTSDLLKHLASDLLLDFKTPLETFVKFFDYLDAVGRFQLV